GAAMHEQEAVLLVGARPLRQELPALLPGLPALGGGLELSTGPEDGPLGGAVEPLGVEHGPLVVVAQQDHLALHHQVDALQGVGAVADHVPKAVDVANVVPVDVSQDRLEGLEVAMNVTDYRLHAWLSRVVAPRQGSPRSHPGRGSG